MADGQGLHDLLARALPDEVALIDDTRALSFAALATAARDTACRLRSVRQPDSAVAILAENSADYVTWLYAIPQAGMSALLLNVRDHPRSWAAIVARSGCSLVAGDAALLERFAPDAPAGVELLPFDAVDGFGDPATDLTAITDTDPAWIVPTSGTTGTPKLALLTHASLLAAAKGCGEARPVASDDVYLLAFPLCHVAAYNVLVQHLYGRTVVLTRRFDPVRTAALIERHRVTVASLAPTMIAALLDALAPRAASPPGGFGARSAREAEAASARGDGPALHDVSSLRLLAYGSAPIAEPLLRRAMTALGCGFSQGYGMTELSGNCAYLNADDHARGLDEPELLRTAGRPTSMVELRIVDDDGQPLPAGAVGEIAVRGPQVMAGYLGDADATGAAIVDGWLRTGDLGRVDTRGYLTVVDRKKDVIVSGGENVASREVEAVLHADPTVGDAAVVGSPDERWGERVTAVVVAAPGATVDPDALVARCRAELAGFKVPRLVFVVDELPRNATGKVDKPEIRRRLADQAIRPTEPTSVTTSPRVTA